MQINLVFLVSVRLISVQHGQAMELFVRATLFPVNRFPLTMDFFDYNLPEELIAAEPLSSRSASRLLVIDRKSGSLRDRKFTDIVDYFSPGNALVINDTKVIKAKLSGVREANGKAIELLFLHDLAGKKFSGLAKGASRLKEGEKLLFPDGTHIAYLSRDGEKVVFDYSSLRTDIYSWLEENGTMPIPPYIEKKRKELKQEAMNDSERYQTVFARQQGSVAAPTAGLHFTAEILDALRSKGVRILPVTLHVGIGTFKPVRTDDYRNHAMDGETYRMSEETCKAIIETKRDGKKVFASGSTVTRTLETIFGGIDFMSGEVPAERLQGETALYIHGEHTFSAVDHLITNFHLPKSTLLLLASSFAGANLLQRSYEHAIREGYRFFSYGDATLIL